jgi:hypothetical protein
VRAAEQADQHAADVGAAQLGEWAGESFGTAGYWRPLALAPHRNAAATSVNDGGTAGVPPAATAPRIVRRARRA